jgi:crossover junction endodeoxyribonuclease RuvC
VIILGIDPGYDIVGWGLVKSDLTLIDYGVIKTSPKDNLEERYLAIHTGLDDIIKKYLPGKAALEKLFFANNSKTAMAVSGAIGVIMLTLKLNNIPFADYTPKQIKQAITGSGSAEKEQMQFMMSRILKQKKINGPDDASDALAIALCHAMSRGK